MTLSNLIQEKYDTALKNKDLLFYETTKVNMNVNGVEVNKNLIQFSNIY